MKIAILVKIVCASGTSGPAGGLIQQNIKHLDLTDKDRVARKSQLLLHRYAEAEAGVAENEPKK